MVPCRSRATQYMHVGREKRFPTLEIFSFDSAFYVAISNLSSGWYIPWYFLPLPAQYTKDTAYSKIHQIQANSSTTRIKATNQTTPLHGKIFHSHQDAETPYLVSFQQDSGRDCSELIILTSPIFRVANVIAFHLCISTICCLVLYVLYCSC